MITKSDYIISLLATVFLWLLFFWGLHEGDWIFTGIFLFYGLVATWLTRSMRRSL